MTVLICINHCHSFSKNNAHFPPAYLAAAADVQEQVRGRLLKLKADLRAAQSKLATVNTVREGWC